MFNDGKRHYVQFDKGADNIIRGDTQQTMGASVAQYLNDKVREGRNAYIKTSGDERLWLTDTSVAKLTTPNKDMTNEQFKRKLRAVLHIVVLAKTSIPQKISGGRINIKADFDSKHDYWEVAQDGWEYRNAFYMDADGQYYKLQMSISVDGTIESVYNIGRFYEEKFPTGNLSDKASRDISIAIISIFYY